MLNTRQEIEPYMPHSGGMLLLDRVIEHSSSQIVTELVVATHLPCYANDRVPAYLGIEVMAQSIAAWAGLCRGDPTTRPPIGFLLGTRRFESTVAFFDLGSKLITRAKYLLENDGLTMFKCYIDYITDDWVRAEVATANVNVYSRPNEPALK